MSQKVGDIYVDLSVRMEDTSKAVNALNKAFGRLAKSTFSVRPRIDRRAIADIGKAGADLSKSLSQAFDRASKMKGLQNLEKSATKSFGAIQKEIAAVDKEFMRLASTTATGKKYVDALASGTEAAARAYQKFISSSSRIPGMSALRTQRAELESVAAGYRSTADAAKKGLAEAAASSTRLTNILARLPSPIRNTASAINNELGRAFQSMAGMAERSAGRASNALERMGQGGQKAFGVLRFLSYQVISAVERMAGAFLRAGFQSAAAIGYTQAALKQIQVNIEKAKVGYDKLSKAQQRAVNPKIYAQASKQADRMTQSFITFSQNTPYALDQIQEIGQQLLIARSGLQVSTKSTFNLLGVMRSLGDIAAATGKSVEGMRSGAYVLQQIGQSGQIMGDDLRQLHNAIPNWKNIIAQQMGKPVSEITNKVAKSTKGINALFAGLSKGQIGNFSGVLEAQNKTVAGQFQRMVETVHNGVGQIINAFGPILKPALHAAGNLFAGLSADIVKSLNNNRPAMKKFSADVRSTFASLQAKGKSSGLFDAITSGAKQIIPILTNVFNGAKTLVQNFFAGFSAGGGGAQFSKLIDNIQAAFTKLYPIMQKTGNQIMSVLGPAFTTIGNMIATNLLPAINRLIPVLTPVVGFLLKVFGGALVGAIKGVVNVIKGLITFITGIINVFTGVLTGNWSMAWNGLKQIVMGALQAIWGGINVWLNVGILTIFRTGLLKLLPAIVRGGMGLVRALFAGGLKGIGAILRGLPGLLLNIGRAAMNGYVSAISAGRSHVFALFKGFLSTIPAILRGLVGLLGAAARAAIAGFVRGVVPAPVYRVFKALATGALRVLKSGFSGIASIGSDIIGGLVRGIEAAGGAVGNALVNIAKGALQKAKNFLKIGSPSKVMAKEVGQWIPAGIAVGIETNTKKVTDAIRRLSIKVGKAGERGATHIVTIFGTRLRGIASKMDFLNLVVDAAKKRLDDLKAIRQSYQDVFTGFTDLSSLGNRTNANGDETWSFANALADLKAAKQQAKDLATLGGNALNLGVSKQTLDAILNLGPEKATQWFQGIIQGGKQAAQDVNSYFSTFASAGGALGDQVTKMFEGSTVAAASALVTSLQKQQANLQKVFNNVAIKFAHTLIATLNSTKGGINVGYGPPPKPPKKPKKGPKKAIGTMSWRGGPVTVGENGREMLSLPGGTRIYKNSQTESMLRQNGPVELSPESIRLLAAAILAGASRVSQSTVEQALTGLAVR